MTASDIKNIIKAKLDELTPYSEGLVVSGVSYADQTLRYIEQVLDESIRDLIMQAPEHLLPQTELKVDTRPIEGQLGDNAYKYKIVDKVLTFELPTDFVRLIWLQLPSWKIKKSETISVTDPNYKIQGNGYTRGTPSRPVIVKLNDKGKLKLQCFTVSDPTEIGSNILLTVGVYVKTLTSSDVPDILIDSLTWLAASKVLLIYGKLKESELAYKQYQLTLLR